jgi:rhamnogalacturonyl hydrolase YesR
MKKMKRIISLALAAAMSLAAFTASAAEKSVYEKPEYDSVISTIELVNDYWITHNDVGSSFWERGAYNTGNIEAYCLTGIEDYREYAEKWANRNLWMGNRNTGDKSKWTWGYTGDVNSTGALFGDWQICFQTYADLYNFDTEKDESKIARAREVMEYEMSKDENKFWWWADGLYMVMPVMAKLHNITGNELYLDKLYEYFKYAKELMYDGKDGIAGRNPEEYANLFYRDGGYVNSVVNGQKNFWARGDGWVFAGLAKVLQETPDDWEHRDYFLEPYLSMAEALKNAQKFDDEGRGFWTQSILAHDYSCADYNPEGYETSGTAFNTYAFLWGINSGLLDEDEYKDTALAGWKYLTEVAIHDDGKIGYVQWVGGEAGKAAVYDNTQDFAVGATLLAGCEMAKYVGGMQGYFYPYLQRRLVNTVSLKINSPYAYANSVISQIDENNDSVVPVIKNDRTLVPVRVISESFGTDVSWDENTQSVTIKSDDKTIVLTVGSDKYTINGSTYTLDAPAEIIENRTFVPLRAIAEALGKIVWYSDEDKTIVIGYKNNVFYDCEKNMETMLSDMLETGEYPETNPVNKGFVSVAELKDKAAIKPVSATATAEPESFNSIAMAIDGDVDTRWASDVEADLIVDFGSVQYFEKVGIYFWRGSSGNRSTTFDLYVSEDGDNYEKIYSGESLSNVNFSVLDVGKNIRYVKVHGYKNSENNWVNVKEIIGFGSGTKIATNLK